MHGRAKFPQNARLPFPVQETGSRSTRVPPVRGPGSRPPYPHRLSAHPDDQPRVETCPVDAGNGVEVVLASTPATRPTPTVPMADVNGHTGIEKNLNEFAGG